MVKLNNKMRWTVSAVFAILILFGTYHAIFSIIAFLGLCLLLLVCERETILLQLFFIMPMANIFKMSPSSQSFFTIILLLYVVMYFVLPRKATLLIVLFVAYIVIGQLISGSFLLFRTIKLICNILFLSSILNNKVQINHKKVFFSFIIGSVVASGIALMDSPIFSIKDYVGVQGVEGIQYADLTRFTGLHTDPNYYTVGMIISLMLVVILYHRKEIRLLPTAVFFVTIVYFLLLTYSKSAVLLLLLPLMFLLYSLVKQKKAIPFIVICFIVLSVVIIALSGKIELLNVVVSRFKMSETAEGTDLNSLTTGRFGLWIYYIKYIINDLIVMFFGRGISSDILSSVSHGTHNTYLDMLYYLGVFGSFLLISILAVILSQSKLVDFKRKMLNYSVMACIIILYFFLSELFYFDPPFHIFIAFTVLNLPMKNERMTA